MTRPAAPAERHEGHKACGAGALGIAGGASFGTGGAAASVASSAGGGSAARGGLERWIVPRGAGAERTVGATVGWTSGPRSGVTCGCGGVGSGTAVTCGCGNVGWGKGTVVEA